MSQPTPNPDGCCGVKTQCCGDKIPVDKPLTATYSNSCGDFTIKLIFDGSQQHPTWAGTTLVECFNTMNCQSVTAAVELICENGTWHLRANSDHKWFDSSVCGPPLMMVMTDVDNQSTPCNSPADLATVTVTE